jgi:primosomal protein N' (replication factor Y) (superfamily II helicase)
MYAKVRLLNGWAERLIYKIPSGLHTKVCAGALVTVPLQKRTEIAYVEFLFEQLPPKLSYAIKDIQGYEEHLNDPSYLGFINQLAHYYAIEPISLYNRFCSFLKQKQEIEKEAFPEEPYLDTTRLLTDEQQNVVDGIVPSIDDPAFKTFVIHGVTGSGKTEVYHHLIAKNNALNKTTILLLPEVSLAVQFTELFKKRFASWPVYGFHSGTSITEKKALWNHVRSDKAALIIGVHLPILLPIPSLGLIIIDEEHETGYQEKKYPKINTKEAALIRAQITKIPIVLGSATPSLQTLYNVKHRGWKLFSIKKRFAGAFPQVKIIQLTTKEKRPSFWISKELEKAIADRLAKKEQIIIFLNRRGYSFFVQCGGCGFIFRCSACSVSLTLHNDSLCCHYCGHQEPLKTKCTTCSSSDLIKKGIGTQQVVSILERLFPHAKIGRADHDATVNKKKWQATLRAFGDKELDILVGTQTITKGYHFPHVTLVGVLWADINLSIPTYNAAEVTLQQLIQVAGRAGRQHPESLVIIQTMLHHDILNYVNETTYPAFYDSEIKKRTEIQYPPLVRFAELELRNNNEELIDKEAEECASLLHNYSNQHNLKITLLGPAQPPVHKIKHIYIRKIYVKAKTIQELLLLFHLIQQGTLTSSISFTPNPLTL